MFQSTDLDQHLRTAETIANDSRVYAEINMNIPDNVERIGVYRYHQSDPIGSQYKLLPGNFDPEDQGDYYTDATLSYDNAFGYADPTNLDPSVTNDMSFKQTRDKITDLYPIEDCLKPYRPRAGVNKLLYLGNTGGASASQYIDMVTAENSNSDLAQRPRYYMSSRQDYFKYWTSYKNEGSVERGISYGLNNLIDDAVPFVVYKNEIPANRIVIKMQTNVGTKDRGYMREGNIAQPDPLFGYEHQTTPVRWRIQVLKGDSWIDAMAFNASSLRKNGNRIIGTDGYVELGYGLKVPDEYYNTFRFKGEIVDLVSLPDFPTVGDAYLLKQAPHDKGVFHIFTGSIWAAFAPEYAWQIEEDAVDHKTKFVKTIMDPEYFLSQGSAVYTELDFIRGIRVVVESMNVYDRPFDLIEMSPRLTMDLTERVAAFKVTKTMADLANSSLPVGSLLVSTGSVSINNNDGAFNDDDTFAFNGTTGSVVSKYLKTNIKFMFYDVVSNVNGLDYFVPLKTLFTEVGVNTHESFDNVELTLRDYYFIFESTIAPQLLMYDVSLSRAIVTLLDYTGFTNYHFKRIEGQADPIIPFFFVSPNKNIAQVLAELALATQSAMYFDEYNNFVVSLKEHVLPSAGDRDADFRILGNDIDGDIANIKSISTSNKQIFNAGQINYTKRYIQRTYGTLRQAMYQDADKTWIYAPTLLWEVTGDEATKATNDSVKTQSSYALSAFTLNSPLSADIPAVDSTGIINNVIDVGESANFAARYNGYLYSNGEIIRYDAVQYSVSGVGLVWIENADRYQNYLLSLPFNGKMYPTGLIRIWAEPNYETVAGVTVMSLGQVANHGRGQFGTPVLAHSAGIDTSWTSDDNVRGCIMESDYLFDTDDTINYPQGLKKNFAAGVDSVYGKMSSRNGIIKNNLAQRYISETDITSAQQATVGSLQSSALVVTGPTFPTSILPKDHISYVVKPMDNAYKHFGTRMRIIGKINAGQASVQTPVGNTSYITVPSANSIDQTSINGGSGGLGIMVNPATNAGYYFEIAALTSTNATSYNFSDKLNPVVLVVAGGSLSVAAGVVTVVTTEPHGLKVGEKIKVMGFDETLTAVTTQARLDQTIASVVDQNTFTYVIANTMLAGTSLIGGTVTRYYSTGVNVHNVFFYKIVSDDCGGNILSYARAAGVLTITVDDHRFSVGDQVTINGGIDTSLPGAIMGTHIVTAIDGNVLTFASDGAAITTTTASLESSKNIYLESPKAVPYRLWAGLANVVVDSGTFVGQSRVNGEAITTVYDLAVEYKDVGSERNFYLYVNNMQIATVVDPDPLTNYASMAPFVRGSSKVMFENVYALTENYSQNTVAEAVDGAAVADAFGITNGIDSTSALRKYAINGFVQSSYLTGIGTQGSPKYNMYYEEFGTIMREAAYFNIKYDRAYPALYAKIAPTFNSVKSYAVSGFMAEAYGAEFLVFNCLDNVISLDATSGNYLRIVGVTFTQNTTKTITVDDYYGKNAKPTTLAPKSIAFYDSNKSKKISDQPKISRMKFGRNEFTIDSEYIQSSAMAENLMGWIVERTMVPKQSIGVDMFPNPTIQLGDIATIYYRDHEGRDVVASLDKQFVVYTIEYTKGSGSYDMALYVAEV